ncbi:hypothetical protein A4X03_0g2432 [Tilletia caries]|uniref:Uncharacterized protein n=1 Tax=Tilletia caries TaxID=13290 RepID=A0A8T8TMK5_9BASI|nr:hypothetical protein CF335_g3118 [Tilletia laevis]KAE8262473.1 hypothetical protein A4X03_0g2432 [Tilletia caries]
MSSSIISRRSAAVLRCTTVRRCGGEGGAALLGHTADKGLPKSYKERLVRPLPFLLISLTTHIFHTHTHTHTHTLSSPPSPPTNPIFNMSDTGRRDISDQLASNVKPDSQKSFVEQGKEKLDSLASSAQPQSEKSTTQKIGDSVSGNSNQNQGSIVDSVKDTLGLGNSNTKA